MLKKILVAVVCVIAVLTLIISLQPSAYRVQRSASIAAPPSEIFTLINDFHNWDSWSPWAHLDPAMKKTINGPRSGIGANYMWSGNDEVGEGRMSITESQPYERIRIRLEFIKPFAAVNATEFNLRPEGSGSAVDWTMTGENDFIGKAFSLFMNTDKMIGADFEKGLSRLKSVAERKI
jgi:Polyketide cyclase / dehydrase and lipid transport